MPLIPNVGRKKIRYRLLFISIASLLWLGVGLHLFPFYWALTSSMKNFTELYHVPPTLIPRKPTLQIWKIAISYTGTQMQLTGLTTTLPIALKNSLIMTFGAMAIQIPFTALAAYALSKLETPKWERVMFLFFIATMLVPGQISLIPRYLLIKGFPFIGASAPKIPFTNKSFPTINFLDSYWAVILPAAYSAFNVLLFKGFFDTIPNEILNAARLDGASEFRIFTRIILPLSKPVLAVVAYFSFSELWNQFMWPLIVFNKREMHPLSLMIYQVEKIVMAFAGTQASQKEEAMELYTLQAKIVVGENIVMVFSIIQSIPLFVMFIILREQLMKGVKLRGFK